MTIDRAPLAVDGISYEALAADRGKRADKFLSDKMATHPRAPSRSEIARWITNGRVTSARGVVKAADKVRPGDVLVVRPEAPEPTTAEPDPSVVFTVLHVDDAVVVVDKPAGLVVHPAAGHATGTLVNGLLARGLFDRELTDHASAADHDADDPREDEDADAVRSRPGIVHRIDKDTSGVLVVARTAHAREKLKVQFAAHTCERVYEAICTGVVGATTFATLYGRNPKHRMMFSSRVREGKSAVTHVAPRAVFGRAATHVECRLETGRTHQIRVHLADAGHALLADKMYGTAPKDPALAAIASALGRQALHARLLGFVHPTTERKMVFESPLPADMATALASLEAEHA